MGPIEKELRGCTTISNDECYYFVWSEKLSDRAFRVVRDAALSLGFGERGLGGVTDDARICEAMPDVLSEAVEAAAALGL